MKLKKYLSILLVLALLAGLLPIAALAVKEEDMAQVDEWIDLDPTPIDSWEGLAQALSQTGYYRLTQDLKLPAPADYSQPVLTVPEDALVVLELDGKRLDFDYGVSDDTYITNVAIEVQGLLGLADSSDDVGGIEGAAIGVRVAKASETGDTAYFLMGGGDIDASICGVQVGTDCGFYIMGGTVYARSIGVAVQENAAVLMGEDAEICGNAPATECIGVYNAGAFLMTYGLIHNCTTGVISLNMDNPDEPAVYMLGGMIRECTDYAMDLNNGTALIAGIAEIEGNANGILVDGAVVSLGMDELSRPPEDTMKVAMAYGADPDYDDPTVIGGAVGIEVQDGTCRMITGEIIDAEIGVDLVDGVFEQSGGSISESTDYGVRVGEETIYRLQGDPGFSGNQDGDVYLADGSVITLSGALESQIPIRVAVQTPPTADGSVTVTDGLSGNAYSFQFASAAEGCFVDLIDGEVALCYEAATEVGDWAALQAALVDGAVVRLTQDVEAGETDLPLTLPAEAVVKLDLNGHLLSGELDGLPVFILADNCDLTVEDNSASGDGRIVAPAGSVFQMNDGDLTLRGGTIRGSVSGVTGSGTVVLTGGEISNCGTDGGVLLQGESSGLLLMSGTIRDNAGNGVTMESGVFYLAGGRIENNAENGVCVLTDSGLMMLGGVITGSGEDALVVKGGEVIIMSGSITGNHSGVWVDGGSFAMRGGEICANDDNGVYITAGTAAISGGEISYNGSDGVWLYDGKLELSGDPVFLNNNLYAEEEEGENDIFLGENKRIDVTGTLSVADAIAVNIYYPSHPAAGQAVVITNGLPGRGSVGQFTTDSAYKIDADVSGEAVFAAPDYVVPTPYYDDGGSTPAPAKKDETKKDDEAASVTFTDVAETAWYAGAADFAAKNGLFEGIVAEGEEVPFYPEAEMTRGEAVRALWNLAGKPPMEGVMPFDDVAEGSFYAAAAGWAGNAEIVKGTDAGFDPDAPITREQFAAMVYRFVQLSGKGFEGMWSFRLDFPDAGEVSDWALEGVSWLVMNGILKGMDGELNPQGVLTRAQLAALLQRVAEALEA